MTKVIVSVSALVLAERGNLRLDQPVADFIPAFTHLSRLTRRHPHAGRRPPTLQDLLRHTAGIAYGYLGDGPTRRAYDADGLLSEDLDNAAFAQRIARLPLEHEPGTVWHYSHATDVLGRVLEVAGGADLQGVLDDDAPRAARHGRHPVPDPGCDGRARRAAAAAGARAAAGLPRSERPGAASGAMAASSRPWRIMPASCA